MAIKSSEVRAAREFLRKRGVKGISPRQFARSAQETGASYKKLLAMYVQVAQKQASARSENDTSRTVSA